MGKNKIRKRLSEVSQLSFYITLFLWSKKERVTFASLFHNIFITQKHKNILTHCHTKFSNVKLLQFDPCCVLKDVNKR